MKIIHGLFLFTVFVNQVPIALLKCSPGSKVRGELEYLCTSVQEIIQFNNSKMIRLLLNTNNFEDTINSASFEKLNNLRRIEIRESVGYIEPNTFNSLPSLSLLLFYKNYIPRIRRGIFENLQLSFLDLSGNNISDIEEYAFLNMSKLETLRLSNNNLKSIENSVFNGLPVQTLVLSKNRIYRFKPNAFFNMTKLKHLHLDGNKLLSFEPKTLFNFGDHLEVLWLQNNLFTEISKFTFEGLINLRILNLDSNKISKIFIYTFENLRQLETLLLSNNEIEDLDEDIFPKGGAVTLAMLFLNNNRLTYLNNKFLAQLNGLKFLQMFGNPWQCACLESILAWINEQKIKPKCDNDYYKGRRPICVVGNSKPTVCQYRRDPFYFHTYNQMNQNLSETDSCIVL